MLGSRTAIRSPMADHHITDTIASVTSIATLVATFATAVIAWLVYRYQQGSEQPAIMVYSFWGVDGTGEPVIHLRGSILNRSAAPLAVHGISVSKPIGSMIFEGASASMYARPEKGCALIQMSLELMPKGEITESKFLGGRRDRDHFQLTVFCPADWLGGKLALDFDLSAPGRVEHRKIVRRILDMGRTPGPITRPQPSTTIPT